MSKHIGREAVVTDDEKRLAFRKEQERTDILALLEKPEGRRVIRRLLGAQYTNLMGKSFMQRDASRTAWNEGRRSIGVELKEEIDAADEGGMLKLLTEKGTDEHGH